jgi:hypothetical protein
MFLTISLNLSYKYGDMNFCFWIQAYFGHFFHGKLFVYVQIVYFRSKLGKILPQKNVNDVGKSYCILVRFKNLWALVH